MSSTWKCVKSTNKASSVQQCESSGRFGEWNLAIPLL